MAKDERNLWDLRESGRGRQEATRVAIGPRADLETLARRAVVGRLGHAATLGEVADGGAPAFPSHTKYVDLVEDELLAMDPGAILPVNVDVVASAMTVLGVVKNLPIYRPGLVELFGEERVSKLDRLELLAHAALQAHGRCRALDSSVQLGPLGKEATKYRDVLLAEVRQLITREILDPGTIGELAGVHGYKNVYLDLLQLVAVFRENAGLVEGWCVVKPEYLDRAENAAGRLAMAIGMREQAGPPRATDLRNRAFTLLWHTYEEARRLITCLRWHERDYDRIAPTFFAGRPTARRRRRTNDDRAEGASIAPPPAAPLGMPGGPAFAPSGDDA